MRTTCCVRPVLSSPAMLSFHEMLASIKSVPMPCPFRMVDNHDFLLSPSYPEVSHDGVGDSVCFPAQKHYLRLFGYKKSRQGNNCWVCRNKNTIFHSVLHNRLLWCQTASTTRCLFYFFCDVSAIQFLPVAGTDALCVVCRCCDQWHDIAVPDAYPPSFGCIHVNFCRVAHAE